MARGTRQGHRGHGGRPSDVAKQKHTLPALDAGQSAQVETLLAEVSRIAEGVRSALPDGREPVAEALKPMREADEVVALHVAARLGDARGNGMQDAAVVADAVGALDSRREVAREARKARLRLRSVGATQTLQLPPPASPKPQQVETGTAETSESEVLEQVAPAEPQFAEGYVTRTRESGELSLIVGWQEGADTRYLRGHLFLLDFWHGGIRDFTITEPLPRARFREELTAGYGGSGGVLPVSWAQARHLVLEALAVNTWRGVEPHQEFRRHQEQIERRLLAEPLDESQRADVEAAAREGDRRYIATDLEPEETVGNWIGAWAFGDFGLAYDLLADDNPLRRAMTREEYLTTRQQWADEAKPAGLRLTLVREQAQRASALWVPGAAGLAGAGERKELEAFWSVVLIETPIAGQLDEMPMATLASTETGRHWYWTAYTVARDRGSGLWLISRVRDEGATVQALKLEELQRRIQEAREKVHQITQSPPPDPQSEEAAEALRTITGELTAAMHYSDALSVRLPLDEELARAAANDARSLGNHERAAAIIERMRGRFSDDTRVRFEMSVEQYLVAEQHAQQGDAVGAAAWLERAVATMTAVVEAEPTAEHLQGLGELLARQGHFNQAETRLREALELEPERALVHSDLADTLMGRITGENLDDPVSLSNAEKEAIAREALAQLRETVRLDPELPGVFTRIGAIYEVLGQPDDALVSYEEALRRDPGDAEAHYTLGTLHMSRQQAEAAVPHFETAVQLSPVSLSFRLGLAAGYAAMGRRAEATRELDLIDRVQPGLPQVAELRSLIARGGRARN